MEDPIHIDDDTWLINYYANEFAERFLIGKSFSELVKFSRNGVHITIAESADEVVINYSEYKEWCYSLPIDD
jgi:hypothetical protein